MNEYQTLCEIFITKSFNDGVKFGFYVAGLVFLILLAFIWYKTKPDSN